MIIKIQIFKILTHPSNQIINHSLDLIRLIRKTIMLFNNYTSNEVSDDIIILHDSCHISSINDHNSHTHNFISN